MTATGLLMTGRRRTTSVATMRERRPIPDSTGMTTSERIMSKWRGELSRAFQAWRPLLTDVTAPSNRTSTGREQHCLVARHQGLCTVASCQGMMPGRTVHHVKLNGIHRHWLQSQFGNCLRKLLLCQCAPESTLYWSFIDSGAQSQERCCHA